MTLETAVGFLLAVAALVYLLYALVRPEKL